MDIYNKFFRQYSYMVDLSSNRIDSLPLRMKHYYDDTRPRLIELENHGEFGKIYTYPCGGILMPLKVFMREVVSYEYSLTLKNISK